MPTPRVISAAGVVRSKIVVAGGLSTRKGRNLNANEIYDPIADNGALPILCPPPEAVLPPRL